MARRGDMLCAPFQCDSCWFVNIKGRIFDPKRAEDRLNISLIQRVNLDVFWDKEPSTVKGMYQVFVRAEVAASHLKIVPRFLKCKGPWPLDDQVGFGEAMILLWDSVQPSRTDGKTRQFDTIRKLRSLSANLQSTSCQGGREGVGFRDGGNMLLLSQCSTNSVLFGKFIKGCEKRMGRIVRQDTALSVPILLKILNNLDCELKSPSTTVTRKREVVMLGSFLVIGFCDALRGNEIFLVEAANLCKYWQEKVRQQQNHVVVPLMGRFKGETGERNVLRFLVNQTQSGIAIDKWVGRLVRVLMAEGRICVEQPGPAFVTAKEWY